MESFDDLIDVCVVFARTRGAVRYSLAKALEYAHEADRGGNYPRAIIALGKNYRFDRADIERGWKQLGFPMEPRYPNAYPAKNIAKLEI